uniref:ABC transporter ATP-binding protein n=1 Tax=candidate division WOR-3 bacterium TaxID=2052148 RepID=A0A7C4YH71_UNCW3
MIILRNIKKFYEMGETPYPALRGVNLDVKKGEFLCIMGPSGSGKSTLLHILGCLDKPTEGEYILENENVSEISEDKLAEIRRNKIGFVFQNFYLLPRATSEYNVTLPMIYARVPLKERILRARELLKSVGLGERLHYFPNKLSGGERQRVAIARALANNPEIILADEPTGNLDSKSGEEIMEIFMKLHKQGKTIILVTHERDIAAYSERIVHIKDGLIDFEEKVKKR